MRKILGILAAGLIGCASGHQPPSDKDRTEKSVKAWGECVRQLESMDSVTGDAVGYAGGPGKFFLLSRDIVEVGNEEAFRELLKDKRPVVRCMGLLALSRVLGRKAAPVVKSHLADRGRILYGPGGCVFSETTVGRFAFALLLNANHLEHSGKRAPLLAEREVLGLAAELLAADSTTELHFEASSILSDATSHGKLLLELPALRKRAPLLQDCQIIKAVGRMGPTSQQRTFLVKCMNDSGLEPQCRLAAASGLSRDSDKAALAALEQAAPSLNRISTGSMGTQSLDSLKARILHEGHMRPIHAEKTWRGLEQMKQQVIAAFTIDHPLALDDLSWGMGLTIVVDDADVRKAWADSLVRISRNLGIYSQPWNTYSNAAYLLDAIVSKDRENMLHRRLTASESAEIEKNIRAWLSAEVSAVPSGREGEGRAEALKAKAALLALMRAKPGLFEGADPDRFDKVELKPGADGRFTWGAFTIDTAKRTYSATVASEAAFWAYQGRFTVAPSGEWQAENLGKQHATAGPPQRP